MGWFSNVRKDTRATMVDTDGDAGPLQLTANGDARVRDDDLYTLMGTLIADLGGATTYVSIAVDLAKNGTRDIIAAPGANKQLWIYGFMGTTIDAGTVKLQDSTPTAKTGTVTLVAGGGYVLAISPNANAPWFKCATNTKFQAVLSADADFDGVVVYAIIDV